MLFINDQHHPQLSAQTFYTTEFKQSPILTNFVKNCQCIRTLLLIHILKSVSNSTHAVENANVKLELVYVVYK